ncbi:MAG: type III pantothenate kinase [Eubacteriales bacterium]|nr:type III pantothenate kinase [Eubacteriales bacterium]
MILTFDVGNTNIVIGGFDNHKLVVVSRLATRIGKTEDEYAIKLKCILSLNDIEQSQIDGCIISSVVPQLNLALKKAVSKAFGVDSIIVGPGIKTGINIKTDNPAIVGADLICASVAADNLYDTPVLILDMGTATKIMVVDDDHTFMGLSIIPGMEISMNALSGGTAQLPYINLEIPPRVLGRNTIDCMRSGAIFGTASMIDGMVDRIAEELGVMPTLVATGGLCSYVVPSCKHEFIVDDHLLLKGLDVIYHKNM